MFFRASFVALLLFTFQTAWGANTKDLLEADRLGKHLKAKGDQKEHIAKRVSALRDVVIEYQTERGRAEPMKPFCGRAISPNSKI